MVILFDIYNVPEDVYEVVFATKQQKIVAKVLIEYIKVNGTKINKVQMSRFATDLHEGKTESIINEEPYKNKKVKLKYNKRQFYDRILTPMKAMGMIEFNLYQKTYKLSDKLYNGLLEVGLKWRKELEKEPIIDHQAKVA